MFNLLIGSVITGSCDGCLDALNLLANPTSLLLVGATLAALGGGPAAASGRRPIG
jgi:hypothetical protein